MLRFYPLKLCKAVRSNLSLTKINGTDMKVSVKFLSQLRVEERK